MFKRVLFLILSLAVLVGMGLATSAAFAANGVWGQERWRWEGWNNVPTFWTNGYSGTPPAKDVDDSFGYSFLRSRIGYSTDIGEHGIFNVAVENTRIFGLDGFGYFPSSEPNYWMNDQVILHEGYLGFADFLTKGLDVYAGRFGNLAYGRERILGPEDWSFYYKNRFDGFKSHYMFEKGWFDLLCLKLNETLTDKYDTGEGESVGRGDTDLRGVYAHFDPMDGLYVEPYVLWASMDNYFKDPSVSNDNFFTFGALVDYMSDMGLHFYGEGVIQSGKTHGLDMVGGELKQVDDWKYSAFGAYVGVFYEADMTSRPFIGAEFNYASGTSEKDAYPSDPNQVHKWKTFHSPFGSYSTYMGIMNMVDWANTASLRFSAGLTPVEKTDIKLDVYLFRLANDEDYAYGGFSFWSPPAFGDIESNGLTALPAHWTTDSAGVSHANKSVGTEFDLMINHQVEENVTLQGGVSMFKYGDYFGKNVVDGKDQDWANTLYGWLGAQVQF